MKISDIDTNFRRNAATEPEALAWYDRPDGASVFRASGPQAAAPYAAFLRLYWTIAEGCSRCIPTAGMCLASASDSALSP